MAAYIDAKDDISRLSRYTPLAWLLVAALAAPIGTQQVILLLACATSLIGIAVIVMYRNATPAPGAYGVDPQ